MIAQAQNLLNAFETFLASIPLERYRQELMPVKTVEQDLPKDLNPLRSLYAVYWTQLPKTFPDYDQFFEGWWRSHLEPLDRFIRQYFWGCSRDFIYLGFKARLYRTFVSVLTQFHFAYAWKAFCSLPLEASADLDMKGIDALVHYGKLRIALQVKKETYRAEARERGRFAQPKSKEVDLIVEVPYTVTRSEEWRLRVERARSPKKQELYRLFRSVAEYLQRWLPNGFVVFQADYPRLIERLVQEDASIGKRDFIGWRETIERLSGWIESLRDQ